MTEANEPKPNPREVTPERLAEIRKRCDAATEGPWEASHRAIDRTAHDDESSGLGLEVHGPPPAWSRGQFARGADATFIAESRTDTPDLCDALAESWAKCNRLLARIKELEEVNNDLNIFRAKHLPGGYVEA